MWLHPTLAGCCLLGPALIAATTLGLDAVPEGCQDGSWLKLGKEANPTTRA